MTNIVDFEDLKIGEKVKEQIHQCLDLVKDIFKTDLLGVYLYGSSILGGLQKYSDLDVFVVIDRASTRKEKEKLIASLLKISGLYMKGEKPPIEMTIVQKSDINPWHYPPTFDFQYGEWLRDDFEQGHTEPWDSKVMPDLAVLIPQILMRSKTLWGDSPDQTLCHVPYTDFIQAITDSLPHLMKDIDHDTRNVLLTLARIWSTVETDTIRSKPKAADWVTHKLPEQYRPIMERAKSICIGTKPEHWDDIKDLIKPCADFMLEQANHKITKIMPSDTPNKFITLA